MSLITDFTCPGGRQRLEAVLADGRLRVRPRRDEARAPATAAFAEMVEGRYATVAAAERALRSNGVHESDSVLWRSADPRRLS